MGQTFSHSHIGGRPKEPKAMFSTNEMPSPCNLKVESTQNKAIKKKELTECRRKSKQGRTKIPGRKKNNTKENS